MAIFFQTQSPQALLTAFNQAIALQANQTGAIGTWERLNQDGVDYYPSLPTIWGKGLI
jgi:hypothetical protein